MNRGNKPDIALVVAGFKLTCCGYLCFQLVQNLDFVKIHVNSDLKVNMTTKKCTNAWTFTITSKVRAATTFATAVHSEVGRALLSVIMISDEGECG